MTETIAPYRAAPSETRARIHVTGPGLIVRDATDAVADLMGDRTLVGVPLAESVPEYPGVVELVRTTILCGIAGSVIAQAPSGEVGRIVADPLPDGGACVTFVPVGFAIHEVRGRDLVCGRGNAEFIRRAGGTWYEGVAAREAFTDEQWSEAQDALDWVMRTGSTRVVDLPRYGSRLAITRPRPGVVRTAAR
jgi:hypothetical protein